MSFAELQTLKEKLGTKVFNEAMFDSKAAKKKSSTFTRDNKNRPREMSTKRQVSRLREIVSVKKRELRDPRFDGLCGTFDEKSFKKNYGFLSKVKENDLKKLKSQLRKTDDPEEVEKIKYLIQRLENQLREENTRKAKEQEKLEEKRENSERVKNGEKPQFKKKCLYSIVILLSQSNCITDFLLFRNFTAEKKILQLVKRYEELKNTGKLKKHIQKLRKKNVKRDRKLLKAQIE